ncbi:MAG: hypothetical protein ABH858_06315, partial [Candidatus Omnitrophota bacterium]
MMLLLPYTRVARGKGVVFSALKFSDKGVDSASSALNSLLDIFVWGFGVKGVIAGLIALAVTFAAAYGLARKNMRFAATAILLYGTNTPINLALLCAAFHNWFYNFLDIAFYSSVILGAAEIIRLVYTNIDIFKTDEAGGWEAIKPLKRKSANRVTLAVFFMLSGLELLAKNDTTRLLIESVYWRRLSYDPYDFIPYALGTIAFLAVVNKLLEKDRTVDANRYIMTKNRPVRPNRYVSRRGSSSPIRERNMRGRIGRILVVLVIITMLSALFARPAYG